MNEAKELKKAKKDKQKLGKIIVNIFKMIGKVWHFTPEYIIATIVEGVVWGILNSIEIVHINILFNAFDEGRSFAYVAASIGIMALVNFIGYVFDGAYWEWYIPNVKQKLEYMIHKELFEVAQCADLSCYDDPAYQNDFIWTMDKTRDNAVGVIDTCGKIIDRLVASVAVLAVLFTIDIWIALFLAASAIAMTFIRISGNKLNFKLEKESQPISRKTKYVNRMYHIADCARS